ncbi:MULTISPECIES: hypothetical protein [Corallococcus]|uniref:hypothetical protein n=1 Tax=Corallococcus TaxID=83461 RepID=UPI0011E5D620|nr:MULTISPECIES: hypothetical protein [Corallococcus]NRD51755.1 hypothetical protein [Corallococcus exiguus]
MSQTTQDKKLNILFEVIRSPDREPDGALRNKTPGGRHHMEVGGAARLTAVNAKGDIKWTFSQPKLAPPAPAPPTPHNAIDVAGMAFGQVDVTAHDPVTNQFAPLTFFCGSVVIIGADGKQWRFYADGSTHNLDRNPTLDKLVECNAVVANLTGPNVLMHKAELEPYVTCYVLNLKSFKFDP